MRSLSIFGFGAFGQFMARHLSAHFDLSACDPKDHAALATGLGARWATLAEAAKSEVLILALPVQNFAPLLRELGPHLRARSPAPLVLDVASVKLKPIESMMRLLPPETSIIGTHPLFGPQSGKNGVAGLPIALCRARASEEQFACVRRFLGETLGLKVLEVSPEAHDRQMAYVQGLTHLLSRALGELSLPETPLATGAYQRLLEMRSNLANDSWELFLTIERENPFAADARRLLAAKLAELEARLTESAE
jgi:prephenate dehydrogenase